MADSRRDPIGIPLVFPPKRWVGEVERFSQAVQETARAARAELERAPARRHFEACAARGVDGSSLEGCVKTYVPLDRPPSQAPMGFVFALRIDRERRPVLRFVAFGERHPRPGTRSVYERAHKRLHGRYPDQ